MNKEEEVEEGDIVSFNILLKIIKLNLNFKWIIDNWN